jgi:PEP-CTERM motif-containing protein
MVMDWSDTNATWNFFGGNGVTLDGTEAVATADVTIGSSTTTIPVGTLNVNVLPSLQSWSGGFANRGWYFRPDSTNPATDGILFRSAEDPTATLRPLLSVTYTPVPEPGVMLLTSMGLGALGVSRSLRRRAKLPSA